jgi:hypothetical protein
LEEISRGIYCATNGARERKTNYGEASADEEEGESISEKKSKAEHGRVAQAVTKEEYIYTEYTEVRQK